jgi:hypothetical protein
LILFSRGLVLASGTVIGADFAIKLFLQLPLEAIK